MFVSLWGGGGMGVGLGWDRASCSPSLLNHEAELPALQCQADYQQPPDLTGALVSGRRGRPVCMGTRRGGHTQRGARGDQGERGGGGAGATATHPPLLGRRDVGRSNISPTPHLMFYEGGQRRKSTSPTPLCMTPRVPHAPMAHRKGPAAHSAFHCVVEQRNTEAKLWKSWKSFEPL